MVIGGLRLFVLAVAAWVGGLDFAKRLDTGFAVLKLWLGFVALGRGGATVERARGPAYCIFRVFSAARAAVTLLSTMVCQRENSSFSWNDWCRF